jgi:hypothetical protein
VTVEVNLRDNEGRPEFAASANVWNSKMTDYVMCGQCLDDIGQVPQDNDLFKEIVILWKKYHLNGMYAGAAVQEDALQEADLLGAGKHTEAVEYLKSKGLYEVELTDEEKKWNPRYAGESYRYGHGWLYHPIPEKDLARIEEIIDGKVGHDFEEVE